MEQAEQTLIKSNATDIHFFDLFDITEIQKLQEALTEDERALTYYRNHKETEKFIEETNKEESKD